MQKDDSGAMKLLQVLWEHRQEKTGHSWLRLNQAMHEGLFLAVKMGMGFNPDDLSRMLDRFRAGYWFGESLENFYRCAVLYRNATAYQCFENYRGRVPFIWPDADVHHNYGGGKMGHGIPRLVEGARITWKGELVTITSFNDSATPPYMNACSYARTEGTSCPECNHPKTYAEEKILHRFKITHVELAEAKKALKFTCQVTQGEKQRS